MTDRETCVVNLCVLKTVMNLELLPSKQSVIDIIDEAIELLDADKPKLMTIDEVKSSKGADLFIEVSGTPGGATKITAATINSVGPKGISIYGDSFDFAAYNHIAYGWRCWTKRPTREEYLLQPWETRV